MDDNIEKKEPVKQNSIIDDLQKKVSEFELTKQKMRNVQSKLDNQIDIFTRANKYIRLAFAAKSDNELFTIIVDGIVDIFQLEVGVLFDVSPAGDKLICLQSCNLYFDCDTSDGFSLDLSQDWISRRELIDFNNQHVVCQSHIGADSPCFSLNLAHAIFMPVFNNDRELDGIFLGAITEDSKDFYDFEPLDISSTFMMYCQQMYGIYNNMLAYQNAIEASKAKEQFLANLSHEMRTPMNAIIGMVQIAERSKNVDDLQDCIAKINSNSKHLLKLIDDVLNVSNIDDDKFSLDLETFDLNELLSPLISDVENLAKKKDIDFTSDFSEVNNASIIGDRSKLRKVLSNLFSNALKFTPNNGKISFKVSELSHDSDRVMLRFEVNDNGIGIAEEAHERIFAPFEQEDNGISRQYGGTGLGLTISQKIVQLMDSKIHLKSDTNKGASFYFSVRFDINKDVASNNDDNDIMTDFTSYRVLVVDDIEINREITFSLLEDTGLEFDSAENGQEAVDKVLNSKEGYYDLILMDMQMPILDGCSATQSIRKLERSDVSDMSIIAMTANVSPEDVQSVINAGMDGHIGKPVDYTLLMTAISNAFKRRN